MPTILSSPRIGLAVLPERWAAPPWLRHGLGDAASLAADVLPLCDLLCLALAAWFSTTLRTQVPPLPPATFDLATLAIALAPFVLYDKRFGAVPLRIGTHALRFALFTALALVLGAISEVLAATTPTWLVTFFALGFLSTALTRILLTRCLLHLRRRGPLTEVVAIVGAGPLADRLVRQLRRLHPDTAEVAGIFDDDPDAHCDGPVSRLIELGAARRIDWIVLALPAGTDVNPVVQRLMALAVPIASCPQHLGLAPERPVGHLAGEIPVTLLADRPIKDWDAVAKRMFDLVIGGLLLLVLAPFLAAIAIAIRLDSPGPILFRQRRHGLNNATFDILKFRTMRWDPEGATRELQQTLRDDDRVTPLGRFLRASSIDELPQLFNVLKGEMSLVGPRPHAVNMRTENQLGNEITELYAHRHRVRPGITGWSQINGARGATHTAGELRRRVELDLQYIERWSVLFDLKILALTGLVVIRADNAY